MFFFILNQNTDFFSVFLTTEGDEEEKGMANSRPSVVFWFLWTLVRIRQKNLVFLNKNANSFAQDANVKRNMYADTYIHTNKHGLS